MYANYDKVANVYDLLSRMVFGNSIVKAQVCMLPFVNAGGKILIVGGGTGWILEEIAQKYREGLQIDYVEASAKMIDLSKKKNIGKNEVKFIKMPIEDWHAEYSYDIIITPFFFDNFDAPQIDFIFSKLHKTLNAKGFWLYADFTNEEEKSRYWQKIILCIMYFFFRVTCGIEAKKLIVMDSYFATAYKVAFTVSHYHGFIKSVVYIKQE